jgi:transcription elongation factor GreA
MADLKKYSRRIDESLTKQKAEIDNLLKALEARIDEEESKRLIAKEEGDLRENAAYTSATENLARLEFEKRSIFNKMDAFKHFDGEYEPSGFASIGSTVLLEDMNDKREYTMKLVPSALGDPTIGAVSIKSPVGVALLGKQSGDSIIINSATNTITYIIRDIY